MNQTQQQDSVIDRHRAALGAYIKSAATNSSTSTSFEEDFRRSEEARQRFEAARRDLRDSLTRSVV